MELKSLKDLLPLATLLGVKVKLQAGGPAAAAFISFDTLLVTYSDKESEWRALIKATVLLDGWANFKALHIDHQNKVVYVE